MILHNLMNSNPAREAKQVMDAMWHREIERSWVQEVKKKGEMYGINVEGFRNKIKVKKEAKENISAEIIKDMNRNIEEKEKMRFCKVNPGGLNEYFTTMNKSDAVLFLKTKLNMAEALSNFGQKEGKCPICEEQLGTTEHIGECEAVDRITKVYQGKFVEDLATSDTNRHLKRKDM